MNLTQTPMEMVKSIMVYKKVRKIIASTTVTHRGVQNA